MKQGKISILQVINTARIGGGMRHLFALLKHMPRDRFHMALVAENGGFLVDEIRKLGIPVHFIPMMRSRFDPLSVFHIARIAKKENTDILHLHGTRAGFFGAMSKKIAGVPHSVYTVHGFSFHKEMGPLGRAFYLAIERLCAHAHSHLISVSGTDRDEAIRLGVCNAEQIQTIYNGIDFEVFDPQKVNGYLRKTYRIGSEETVVGTVARLVPQKGIEYFLEMARIVAHKYDHVRFVVIGEGELERQLYAKADSLGLGEKVLFVGAQERMPECYAGLDVVVLSSLWEGHPISLIESLAMERPTVATLTSGSPEIIADGETGFLVEPKNPQQLAEKVGWFIEHPKQSRQMAAEGRRRNHDRFAESMMVQNTLKIYEDLLAGNR